MIGKRNLLGLGGVAGACVATAGLAGPVTFDFQNGQVVHIGAWDWAQTSFVAKGGSAAVENFASSVGACPGNSCDFTVYSHARLTGVTDSSGNPVVINGLGNNFEITTTLSFTETVTGLTGAPGTGGSIAGFATKPGAGEFVSVFYDTTPDANDLTGFGFNDGLEILQGSTVGSSTGFFTITNDALVQMDQFPLNNAASNSYGPGGTNTSLTLGVDQLSLTGVGTQEEITYTGLVQDFSFFLNRVLAMSFNNISQALPFAQVNPSDCFTTAPGNTGQCAFFHVDGTYAANSPDANGGFIPAVGNVNGLGPSNTNGGPDFVAQSDYNASFVPVPGPLVLLGIGFLGLGAARRLVAIRS